MWHRIHSFFEHSKSGTPDSSRLRRSSGSDREQELTTFQKLLLETDYPACVGLVRIGDWPMPIHECWNDCRPSRPARWYIRHLPLSWVRWNSKGSHIA